MSHVRYTVYASPQRDFAPTRTPDVTRPPLGALPQTSQVHWDCDCPWDIYIRTFSALAAHAGKLSSMRDTASTLQMALRLHMLSSGVGKGNELSPSVGTPV